MTSLFRFQPLPRNKNKEQDKPKSRLQTLQKLLKPKRLIKNISIFDYFLCFCSANTAKYRLKLRIVQKQLDREMDLKRFISRQRLTMNAILSLLSSHQNFFASKLSRLVIKEENNDKFQTSDHRTSESSLSSGYSSGAAAELRMKKALQTRRQSIEQDKGKQS